MAGTGITLGFGSVAADLEALKREWSTKMLAPQAVIRAAGARVSAMSAPAPEHNVVGVGIGEKLAAGRPTGVLALKFLVRVKYAEAEIASRDRLPDTVDGLPVDVEEVGVLRALGDPRPADSVTPAAVDPRSRLRPVQPGCSIGPQAVEGGEQTAGTFGALVETAQGRCILSNNHVLADENRLPPGTPIYQPSLLDGGVVPGDQVAELTRFVRLSTRRTNRIDAAVARLLVPGEAIPDIIQIGPPRGKTAPRIDMIVHKFGRTTGYTVGRVTSTATDVLVDYDSGRYRFNDQVIIVGVDGTAFSRGGDSGSLILERGAHRAVALLFAGSSSHTIANPISAVLRGLKATLV